jgi:hypothetical protein
MANASFDFLADSFLLNNNCIDNGYKDFSETVIISTLQEYRKHCLNNLSDLTNNVRANQSELKVVARNQYIDPVKILQSALYLESYVVYDPLFDLSSPDDKVQKTATEFFNEDNNRVPLRQHILNTIVQIKQLQPLVVGGFVKMLPMSYYFEPADEKPIYFASPKFDNAVSDIDSDTKDYFLNNKRLTLYLRNNGRWETASNAESSRRINVRYGDYDGSGLDFYYFDIAKPTPTQDPSLLYVVMEPDAPPPSKKDFQKWLKWCLDSSSKSTLEEIAKHIAVANILQAQPIVGSDFERGLLQLKTGIVDKSITNATAESILNIELPFLDRIDVNELIKWRNHETVFNNFRSKLEQCFRQTRSITDPIELKRFHEDFIHELVNVELPQLNQKLTSLLQNADVNFLGMMFSLVASFQSNDGLLPLIGTAIQGGAALMQYNTERKSNPHFFLHKIMS